MKLFCYLFFVMFFVSCATTNSQQTASFTEEEEANFLNAEEEDLEEILNEPDTAEVALDTKELEEKEASDELEDIDTEFFTKFVDEKEPDEEVDIDTTELKEGLADNDSKKDEDSPSNEDIQVSENENEKLEEPLVDTNDVKSNSENEITDIQSSAEEIAMSDGLDEELPSDEPVNIDENSTSSTPLIFISNIRYEDGNIYIDTKNGEPISYRSRFNDTTKQLILEIPGATIQDSLKWPYIMKEFQSDFSLLQADQKTPDTVRIIIQIRPDSNHPTVVEQSDGGGIFIATNSKSDSSTDMNTSDISNNMIDSASDTYESDGNVATNQSYCENPDEMLKIKSVYDFLLMEHQFCGHKITLDIRDTPLKEILYFLLEETNLNMMIDQNIPDTLVSIRLREVPWDQALVLLMKQNKLAYTRKGNIIHIAQLSVFEQQQENLKKYKQFKQEQEQELPLEMEIVPIAYAEVGGIQSKIQIFKSPKGNITLDTENNALIIQDNREALNKMKQLITELDRPPKQVMIAAKIVEVTENFSRNFGINFGFTGGSPFTIGPLGGLEISSSSPFNFLTGSAPDAGTIGSRIKIGRFQFLGDLDAQLGLAENEGSVKVLSSPRIMALNRQSATVNQSTQSISFSGVIGDGGVTTTQVQKSPISLTLSVTPTVTNVNSIYMQVSMNRSFEGARVGQGQSSAAPTNSRSANTRVLVKSGETIVIGGIYETQSRKSLLGFPLLKYIPIVKWLFSQINTDKTKTELLLFITPRIVEDINQPIAKKDSTSIRAFKRSKQSRLKEKEISI